MPFLSIIISLILLLFSANSVYAVTDPTNTPNNKVGIHILFTDELHQAAKIVNNDGAAAWGYVTIPIQATDRNREKWQKFFDKCAEEKIIPLVRVATTPSGSNWDQPSNFDLIDFANFLNDLKWPVKNRYIIIFNEVNRPDEFGGKVNPEKYADILNNAMDIFKERSEDFFILPAGLDNAAINQYGALHWKVFLRRMHSRHPDIFNKIDGWSSHAYPNPDFSSRPDKSGGNKIDSYRYDLQFLSQYTKKKLPVFITEAGWSGKYLSEKQISYYYDYAFKKVWSDENVVAVTPFLLNAQNGPFTVFSFLNEENSPREFVDIYSQFATKGEPVLPSPQEPSSRLVIAPVSTPSSEVLGTETDYIVVVEKIYNKLKILFGITD